MSLVLRQFSCFLLVLFVSLGLSAGESTGTGLAAQYFANETLSGTPTVSRTDAQVNFNWAGGAAATGLPVDSFSARWDGEIEALYSEPLTLITRTDDGVRLWIDGSLVIDAWVLRSAADSTYTFTAEAGRKYRVRMEYYEHFGSAVAQLDWQSGTLTRAVIPASQLYPTLPPQPPVGTGTGLLARYYANETLSDVPVVSRTDTIVDFNWGGTSPDAAVPVDGFSARWDGEIEARYSEPLTITARTDDGVRVWLDEVLVVDAWVLRSAANSSFTFSAEAGQRYRIRMEYFEHTGAAVAKLWWQSASEFQGPIPSSQLYPTPANDPPVGTGTGLLARFYSNETLSGAPVLTRTDARVDFDWAGGSPGSGVPADVFSARWDGEIEARTTEALTLILRTDDGVRLWLDDQLVINAWVLRGAADSTYTFNVQAGQRYRIRIDYFEHTGSAVAKLWWQSPSEPKGPVPTSQLYPTAPVEPPLGTGTGLAGSYFTNETLTGTPALVRLDPVVDFDWAGGSPASSIPADSFSARWEGEFEPRYSENLTIIARTDDGVRVWIDDQPVITAWILRGAADSTYTFSAQAGQRYRIRMEYYEHFGSAVAKLWWQSAHELRSPIPTTQLYPAAIVETPVLGFASAVSAVSEKSGSTTVSVTLSPASTATVTASLSAVGSGIQIPALLTIPAGETTANIPVTIQDDPRYGPDRQVTIALSNPAGAVFGQTTHVLTLQNTESKPTIGFTTDHSFNLEQSGTASVTVRLSAVSAVPTTVSVVTSGTATAGADYTAPAATLQIPADTFEGTIFIPLLVDAEPEADETIVLTLANPVDATLGGITAHTLTLSDGNLAPVIVSGPTPAANPVTGTSVELTLVANDDGTSASLTTTWSVIGTPPAAVTFTPSSSTGSSASTLATFGAPGTYTIQAQVRDAYNATDTEQVTVTVVAARQPQTITFTAPPAKTYGDAAFTLTATASSGLPVTLTSADPSIATINGNTVTIVGAGSTTITAAQAGDSSWEPATPVTHPLTVAKATQTITFAALTACVVGDAPFTLTATASSGQPVSYLSSNTSVATVSGSTVTIVAAGSTTITASQAGTANYLAAASVDQVLTVTKQTQTITFAGLAGKTYGDAPFTLSATASSGLPVTYTSADPAIASVSGNTVTIVGAGSTTISASQSGDATWEAAATVEQPLTVAKATQTITFAALTARAVGDAPFALGATTSSGLAITYTSSDTNVATVSGNTVTIVGSGTTTITASQGGNANYLAATSVPQVQTITPAAKQPQTITFTALPAKTYGDAPFTLTATASSGLSVSYTSSNTAVATVSGATVTIIGAGNASITASQAGDATWEAATSVTQPLSVAKASQTITFAPLTNRTVGDAPFTLTATASSGLPITYSSSNTTVATVSGSTITVIGAGTTTISASQSGNTNVNAALGVDQPLTVSESSTPTAPSFSPPGGTFTDTLSVQLSATPANAVIHYTTDGSTPTGTSPVYSQTLVIDRSMQVQAISVTASETSAISAATYTIQVAQPTLTPGYASFAESLSVVASTSTADVTLHYTTDGTDPTESSPVIPVPLEVTETTEVRVIGFRTGCLPSQLTIGVFSKELVTPPTFAPASGTYLGSVTVSLLSTTSDTQIWYTAAPLGQTPPDPQPGVAPAQLYQTPLVVTASSQIKAVSVNSAATPTQISAVASAMFTVVSSSSYTLPGGGAVLESDTSPAYLEGVGSTEDMAFTASTVVDGTPRGSASVKVLNDNAYYANFPLYDDQPAVAVFTILDRHGSNQLLSRAIRWKVNDLTVAAGDLVIRVGDSIQVAATVEGGGSATIHPGNLPPGATGFTVPSGHPLRTTYDRAGTYTASAWVNGGLIGSRTIKVVSVDFPTQMVAAEVKTERAYAVPVRPGEGSSLVHFSADDSNELIVAFTTEYDVANLTIKPLKRGTPRIVARIGTSTGPVIAMKEVTEFEFELVYMFRVEEDPLYTGVVPYTLTMRPYLPELVTKSYQNGGDNWYCLNSFDPSTQEEIATEYGGKRFPSTNIPNPISVEKPDLRELQADGVTKVNVTSAALSAENTFRIAWSLNTTTFHAAPTVQDLNNDGMLDLVVPSVSMSITLTPFNQRIIDRLSFSRPPTASDFDQSGRFIAFPGERPTFGLQYAQVGPFPVTTTTGQFTHTAVPIVLSYGGEPRVYWSLFYSPATPEGRSRYYGQVTREQAIGLSAESSYHAVPPPPFEDENGQEHPSYPPTQVTVSTSNDSQEIPYGDVRYPDDGPYTLTTATESDGLATVTVTLSGTSRPDQNYFWFSMQGDPTISSGGNVLTYRLPPGTYTFYGSTRYNPDSFFEWYWVDVKVTGTTVSLSPGRAHQSFGVNELPAPDYASDGILISQGGNGPAEYLIVNHDQYDPDASTIPVFINVSNEDHTQPESVPVQVERDNLKVNLSVLVGGEEGTWEPLFAEGATTATWNTRGYFNSSGSAGYGAKNLMVMPVTRNEQVKFSFTAGGKKTAILHYFITQKVTGRASPLDLNAVEWGSGFSSENGAGNLLVSLPVERFHSGEIATGLAMTYNSLSALKTNYGPGWSTNFDMRIVGKSEYSDKYAYAQRKRNWILVDYDGMVIPLTKFFERASSNGAIREVLRAQGPGFEGPLEVVLRHDHALPQIEDWKAGERWRLQRGDNRFYYFNDKGWLARITDLKGASFATIQSNDYGATKVVDHRGREMRFPTPSSSPQATLGALNGPLAGSWGFAYSDDGQLNDMTIQSTGRSQHGDFALVGGGSSQTWKFEYEENDHEFRPEHLKTVIHGTVDGEELKTVIEYTENNERRIVRPFGGTELITYNTRTGLDGVKTHLQASYTGFDLWRGTSDQKELGTNRIEGVISTDGYLTDVRHFDGATLLAHTHYEYGPVSDTTSGKDIAGSHVLKHVVHAGVTGLDDIASDDLRTDYVYGDGANDVAKIRQIIAPDASPMGVDYTPTGDLKTISDQKTNPWEITARSPHGAPMAVVTPEGRTKLTLREPQTDQYLGSIDEFGYLTLDIHDAMQRTIRNINPGGAFSETYFDPLGRLTKTRDELGREVSYLYDLVGRVRSIHRTPAGADPGTTTAALPDESIVYVPEGSGIVLMTHKRGNLVLAKRRYDAAGRLKEDIVPRTLLSEGDTSVTETTTVHEYKPDTGVLDKIRDARGHEWSFQFDLAGRLRSTTSPEGNTTSQTYNGLGWVLTQTDANGAKTRYTYDATGRPVRTINALGGWTVSGYDPAGLLVHQGASVGKGTSHDHDRDRRPIKHVDPVGNIIRELLVSTGSGAKRTATRDGDAGTQSVQLYDNRGLSSQSETHLDAALYVTSISRRNDGSVASATAPERGVQQNLVDGFGRPVIARSTPQPGITLSGSTLFDPATGLPKSTISAFGLTVENVPDPVTGEQNATRSNSATTVADTMLTSDRILLRDSNGNVLKSAKVLPDNSQLITEQTFDDDNRLATQTGSDGVAMKWIYQGSRVKRIERKEVGASAFVPMTHFEYDVIGNVIETRDATGLKRTVTYDTISTKLTETVGADTTKFIYHPDTRALAKIIHPDGGITEYIPDARGRLGTLVNPRGFKTIYEYDHLDRVARVKRPKPNEPNVAAANAAPVNEQYTYVADTEQVRTHTDLAGRVTTYIYDGVGRLERREINDHGVITKIYTDHTDQRAGGGRSERTYVGTAPNTPNADGEITRAFDRAGRLAELSLPGQSPIALTYDIAGRLANRGSAGYGYKPSTGQLDTITTSDGVAKFYFDTMGRSSRIDLPHGLSRRMTYDPADRLATLTNLIGSSPSELWSHTYDEQGRIRFIDHNADGNFASHTSYTYRGGRLIGEERVGAAAVNASYGYDYNGNRTNLIRYDAPAGHDSFTEPGVLPQLGAGWSQNNGTLTADLPSAGAGNSTTATIPLTLATGSDVHGPKVSVRVNPPLVAEGTSQPQGHVAAGLHLTIDESVAYRAQWQRQPSADFEPVTQGKLVLERLVTNGGATTATLVGESELVTETLVAAITIALVTGADDTLTATASSPTVGTVSVDTIMDPAPAVTEPPSVAVVVSAAGNYRATTSYDQPSWTTSTNRTVQRLTYDGLDRLLGSEDLSGTGTNVAYGRDVLGRMKSRTVGGNVVASYDYDALDRMTSLTALTTTTFAYSGPSWMRRSATVPLGGTTTWLYDDQGVTAQSQGGQTTTFQRHGGSLVWDVYGGMTRSYAMDTHGNVSGLVATLTTGTGQNQISVDGFVQRFDYDAFGQVVRERFGQPGANNQPEYVTTQDRTSGPRYRGMWYDAGSQGLYKTATRFYDPALGQFLQEDPARAGSNWTNYCDGDPVNRSDPSGLDWRWNGSDWEQVPWTPWVKPPPRGLTPEHLGGDTYYSILDHIWVNAALRGVDAPISPSDFASRVQAQRSYWDTRSGGEQVTRINLAYAAWDYSRLPGDAKAGEGMWQRQINDELDEGRWFAGSARAVSYAFWNTFSLGYLGKTDQVMAQRTRVDDETFWQLADANTKSGAKDAALLALTGGAGMAVQSGRAALVWGGQSVNAGFIGYGVSAASVDFAHGDYGSGTLNAGFAFLGAYGLRPSPGAPRTIHFDDTLPAGQGGTTFGGTITISPHGSMLEVGTVLKHETVHSMLSGTSPMRAALKGWGYNASSLLRYSEEAMAETYAQLAMRGASGKSFFGAIHEGLRFPLVQDYGLTLKRIFLEAGVITTGLGTAAAVGAR